MLISVPGSKAYRVNDLTDWRRVNVMILAGASYRNACQGERDGIIAVAAQRTSLGR
jgi:hypothetical protein